MIFKRGRYWWTKFKWRKRLVRKSTRCEDEYDAKNAEKIIRSRLATEYAREVDLRPWRYPNSPSYFDWLADRMGKAAENDMREMGWIGSKEEEKEKRRAQQAKELRTTMLRHLKLGLYETALTAGEKLLEISWKIREEDRALISHLRQKMARFDDDKRSREKRPSKTPKTRKAKTRR